MTEIRCSQDCPMCGGSQFIGDMHGSLHRCPRLRGKWLRSIAYEVEWPSDDLDDDTVETKALCNAKDYETTVAPGVSVSDIGERRAYDKFVTFSERAFRPIN